MNAETRRMVNKILDNREEMDVLVMDELSAEFVEDELNAIGLYCSSYCEFCNRSFLPSFRYEFTDLNETVVHEFYF